MKIILGGGKGAHCVYCRDAFDGLESRVRCRGCNTLLHRECRDELSRCPTLGCQGRWSDRSAPRRREPAAAEPAVTLAHPTGGDTLWSRLGPALLCAFVLFGVWFVGSAIFERRAVSAAKAGRLEKGDIGAALDAWEAGDITVRQEVEHGLRNLDYGAIHELVQQLGKRRDTTLRKRGATFVAIHMANHPGTLDAVCRYLDPARPDGERHLAADSLRRLLPTRLPKITIERMREMLDEGPEPQLSAARGLLRHDRTAASLVPLARLMIRNDGGDPLAAEIATGLSKLDGAGWPCAEILAAGLGDDDEVTRLHCVWALRGCGPDAVLARERLERMGQGSWRAGQTAAAARETLSKLGGLSTQWVLERVAALEDEARRERILKHLLKTDPRGMGTELDRLAKRWLERDAGSPFTALDLVVLQQLPAGTGSWFAAALLGDRDRDVAALASRKVVAARAISALEAALSAGKGPRAVAAAAALAEIDDEGAHWAQLKALRKAKEDPVRTALLDGLLSEKVKWTGGKRRALNDFMSRLRDSIVDEGVRRAAAKVAERARR